MKRKEKNSVARELRKLRATVRVGFEMILARLDSLEKTQPEGEKPFDGLVINPEVRPSVHRAILMATAVIKELRK